MPMPREDHENLLAELLIPELDQTRRTEILQQLRVDYGSVISDFSNLTENNEKLKVTNDDLTIANSKLFRELGYSKDKDDELKDKQEKEKSETITIEDLEKN